MSMAKAVLYDEVSEEDLRSIACLFNRNISPIQKPGKIVEPVGWDTFVERDRTLKDDLGDIVKEDPFTAKEVMALWCGLFLGIWWTIKWIAAKILSVF